MDRIRRIYLRNTDQAINEVRSNLLRLSEQGKYHYLPILIAGLLEEPALKDSLGKIAKQEAAKKMRYRYAQKALERIESGRCSIDGEANYREICETQDPVLRRFRLLRKGSP